MAGFDGGFVGFDQQTYTTAAVTNDNVPISGTRFEVTPTNNNDAITGLDSGGVDNCFVLIINVDPANNLVLVHNSSSSTAGNRIFINSGTDMTLPPGTMCFVGLNASVGWFVFDVKST